MRKTGKLTAVIQAAVLLMVAIPLNVQEVHAALYTTYEGGVSISGTFKDANGMASPIVYNAKDPGCDGSDKVWIRLVQANVLPIFVTSPVVIKNIGGIDKKYGFNFKLWNDKHIAVYGQAADVGINPRIPAQNGYKDWKTEEDDDTCGTYYLYDGERGEYRYHGYDHAGNKYSNTSFPLDSAQSNMNSYKWLYKSWEFPHNKGEVSDWNRYVLKNYDEYLRKGQPGTEAATKVAQWINKMYKDEYDTENKTAETKLDFAKAEAPRDVRDTAASYSGVQAYNYANVMSAPTLTYPGEAKLWVKSAKSGKYYYRTTFIEEINSKIKQTPTVDIKIIKGSFTGLKIDRNISKKSVEEQADYTKYLNSSREITIRLSGRYPDKDYYKSPVLSTAYYTRKDMLEGREAWLLQLSDDTGITTSTVINKLKKAKTANYAGPDGSSSAAADITLTAKVSEIINAVEEGKSTVPVHYKATARFHNRLAGPDTGVSVEARSAEGTFNIPVGASDTKDGSITVEYICNGISIADPEIHSNLSFNTYSFPAKKVDGYDLAPGEPVVKSAVITQDVPSRVVRFNYVQKASVDSEGDIFWEAPLPEYIEPDIGLPEPAFDIVDYHPADNTRFIDAAGNPVDIVSKQVFVDDKPVSYDTFFGGTYTFGESGYDRLANIVIRYTAADGSVSAVSRWIRVLNTKPRVQFVFSGSYKQNRKMTATNTSSCANTPEAAAAYPITQYKWFVEATGTDEGDGTAADVKSGKATDILRELTFKKPGMYRVTLTGINSLGRVSDPYVFDFEIQPDIRPSVICELDNVSVARGETIRAYYFEAVSTDGDAIESTDVSLYYDADDDDEPETLINNWKNVKNGEFPQYTPDKLGKYRWKIISSEKMLGDIAQEHITSDDAAAVEKTRDFWVDNYVPQTGIYSDIPVVRPAVDVFIMTDASLAQEKIDFVKNSRMDLNNYLRAHNILPVLEQWDMKTYTYSQPADTVSNTGCTYPAETSYYTSNGYSGMLTRTSVSDNGSNQDFGSWQSRVESKTASGERYRTCTLTWNSDGYKTESGTADVGSTLSYSDSEGFSGILSRTTTSKVTSPTSSWTTTETTYKTVWVTEPYTVYKQVSVWEPNPRPGRYVTKLQPFTEYRTVQKTVTSTRTITWWSYSNYYTAFFSGNVLRTVNYWVSDWRWVSDFRGFYSGTIYKAVREPYVDPFRPTSEKYVIYVSDGSISQLNDLRMVLYKTGAKLILLTAGSAKTQITADKFILNDRPISEGISGALDYIIQSSPAIEEKYVLAGTERFEVNTDDYDEEGDVIISRQFQYVHDKDYFDNGLRQESGTNTQFQRDDGWTGIKADRFSSPGKYTIYRRIQDQPSTDPDFSEYSYYSGTPMMVIYAHRKPIANAVLDWDFDSVKNTYKTTWLDRSFDPDHQYNRQDKGIVERKIMFRRAGDEWSYVIPKELSPAEYELKYYVRDPEGAWSDPFTINFTLNPAPPMQFDAALRAYDRKFTLSSIPASEYLELYNIWTRFPYGVYLTVGLYRGTDPVGPLQTVGYDPETGTKDGNDINWKNIKYRIPASLADGDYTFKVTAVGEYSQTASKNFNITVYTPVWEDYSQGSLRYIEKCTDGIPGSIMLSEDTELSEDNNIQFTTSKYVRKVKIQIGSSSFFIFRDSGFGISSDETKAGPVLEVNSRSNIYRVKDAMLVDNEYNTAWSFCFATMKGYSFVPDEKSSMVLTAYDTSDNWSTTSNKHNTNPRMKDFTAMNMKLENLRITGIADYAWKGYFQDADGIDTALKRNGIGIVDMPVYRNKADKGIKLGYKVNFELDTVGLNSSGDVIKIDVKYYVLSKDGTRIYPASIFVEKPYGGYESLAKSRYKDTALNIVLNSGSRHAYKADPLKAAYNTWSFSLFLPPDIKVTRQGQELDIYDDNSLKTKLLVVLDIKALKGGETGTEYSYTNREAAWCTGDGSIYGTNRPFTLPDTGSKAGEVFWYDLGSTALDDIELYRRW
ncbi:MAG: hypothetical protein N3I35_05480 [Clostridia bacterium]|nr:hypothetical protein [Clostridia bacterium]